MEQTQSENSYGNIIKRISAFGGVQAFNVLVSIARGKLVAMFLGPAGMGVSSLLTSATGMVQQIGALGLNMAMVKETAAAKDDAGRLPGVLRVCVLLTFLSSLLGGVFCFALAPLLSLWSFGSMEYTLGFMVLSLSVGLTIASQAYLALLQGLGAVKPLAVASLVGGLAGLLFGVPLYYFFGIQGIIPAMIVLATSTCLFNYFSFKKISPTIKAKVDLGESKPLVIKLLKMGGALMVGSMAYAMSTYLVNAFIRYMGSMDDVGLYQSANSITAQYINVIFSALALDYFPRLSAAVASRREFNDVVNKQLEVVSLILTPLIIALIVTAPWIIRILLTDAFLPTIQLTRWLGLGMLVKVMYFPLGYVFLAQNNNRLYLWSEVVFGGVMSLVGSVCGYYFWGLNGLGIGLLISELLTNPVLYLILRRAYGMRISGKVGLLVALSWIVGLATFVAMQYDLWPVGAAILIVSSAFSISCLWVRVKRA